MTAERMDLKTAAQLSHAEVLALLNSNRNGLTSAEHEKRLSSFGPNVIPVKKAHWFRTMQRQLNNPLLWLLAVAATISLFFGETASALVIVTILVMSIALSFVMEYRAELAAAALNSRTAHRTTVVRDGHAIEIGVGDLVPGDLVRIRLGSIVPADIRLIEVEDLECDERIGWLSRRRS